MNSQALRVIRLLLIAIAVGGGLGAIAVRGKGIVPGLDSETQNVMQLAFFALLVSEVVLVLIMRSFREKRALEARGPISLVGWAAAEGTCLFGAVIILMGGSLLFWGLGLALMAFAVAILPAE